MTGAARNAFSVDVEDYFHVSAFESIVDRSAWSSMPSRVVRNTDHLLDLLAQHEVTGTFFVLGWVAEQHPDLVKRVSDAGHEVACHGHSHRKIYSQERDVFREETRRSKAILEDCVGREVIGYRAASFSITNDSMWALDIIAEEGFAYDSSIYPIWHDNYGIPGAERVPSRLDLESGQKLVEFPLSTVRLFRVPLPVGGGGYFRLYPYWMTRAFLKSVSRGGRPINFYCHPWELDTGQPRFEDASWKSRFRHYNNIHKFESRLKRMFAEFEFTTCADVLGDVSLIDKPETAKE